MPSRWVNSNGHEDSHPGEYGEFCGVTERYVDKQANNKVNVVAFVTWSIFSMLAGVR